MINHIELAKECGAEKLHDPFDMRASDLYAFTADQLYAYTNAVIEMCKEHVRGENAYCAVMLEDLKVKG